MVHGAPMIVSCCTLVHMQVASLLASAPRVKEEPIDYSQGDGKCIAERLAYEIIVLMCERAYLHTP